MVDKIPVSEKDLSSFVEDCLDTFQWQWIHIRPARVLRKGREIYETAYTGYKGFLDYLAIRPPRIVVCELKSEKGKLSPEQQEWFDLWKECQRTIIIQPLKIANGSASVRLGKASYMTIPEIHIFRPADWQRIVEILR